MGAGSERDQDADLGVQVGRDVEVAVVGGGAAGLSGALVLARARRSVVVVDAGEPRNAPATGVHGFLTREGMPPAELLAAGRAEVEGYGGEVVDGEVTGARRAGAGFELDLAGGGVVRARRLLVTTGLVDELPDVPGVRELWGGDVVHCPYCHGWEIRDRAVGVLGTGAMSVHQALLFRQWTSDLVYFAHQAPELTPEQTGQLQARGIRIVHEPVAELVVEAVDGPAGDGTAGDMTTGGTAGGGTTEGGTADGGAAEGTREARPRLAGVRLADGTVIGRDAVAVATRMVARSAVLADLGLTPAQFPMNMGEFVAADPSGLTAVPGVWVAGNVTELHAQVITAAAAGVRVAAQINADLVEEDTHRAVAAHRAGN